MTGQRRLSAFSGLGEILRDMALVKRNRRGGLLLLQNEEAARPTDQPPSPVFLIFSDQTEQVRQTPNQGKRRC